MPIKLANNASAFLAAPLGTSDTTVVLNPLQIGNFPSLTAGQWHPLTIIDSSGALEIVKVTERSANVLTVTRAQEGTAALAFATGCRAEIRVTAGAINEIQAESEAYADGKVAEEAADREADIAAERSTSAAERAASVAEIDALRTELLAALTMPRGSMMPWTLTTEPSGWIFADGRTLTGATPYTSLRNAYIAASFPHGQDGSGNPKIPDMRGRTAAGLDNMGGGAAGRLTGATLGAALGAQTHTLSTAELAAHSHSVSDPGHVHAASQDDHTHSHSGGATQSDAAHGLVTSGTGLGYGGRAILTTGSGVTNTITSGGASAGTVYIAGNTTGITTLNNGSGTAHNNVQPTLATHWLVKT